MKRSTLYFVFGTFVAIVLYIMEIFTGAIYYYYLSVIMMICTIIVFHRITVNEKEVDNEERK